MSQASVHEQAYHLLINTALTYQQIADELKFLCIMLLFAKETV